MSALDVIAALVPRSWTGDQALRAVHLLQLAIDAVWWVHGDAMAAVLFRQPNAVPPSIPDDDLPF